MPSAKIEQLTMESFAPYGYFSPMLNPKTERIGNPPIELYRDMLQLDLRLVTKASFSICRVEKRTEVVDTTEYHTSCGELLLPQARFKASLKKKVGRKEIAVREF